MDVLRWEELLKHFKGGRLIDLGCLDSLIPFWAKQKFLSSEVYGLDQAEDVIRELNESFPEINYLVGDVYDTGFPDNFFDYVVAGELIEHLEFPDKFFKEAFRILKPGGTLALTTPREETEAGEVDGERHIWSYSKRDIENLVKPHSKKWKVGEIPSWLRRRIKYHHPYIICFATKR